MGDAIEDLRVIREGEKAGRKAQWARRAEDIAKITALGFKVICLDPKTEQHHRINTVAYGFIDFWPSSWKWHEKVKPTSRQPAAWGQRGQGLESLLTYLDTLPRGQSQRRA